MQLTHQRRKLNRSNHIRKLRSKLNLKRRQMRKAMGAKMKRKLRVILKNYLALI